MRIGHGVAAAYATRRDIQATPVSILIDGLKDGLQSKPVTTLGVMEGEFCRCRVRVEGHTI